MHQLLKQQVQKFISGDAPLSDDMSALLACISNTYSANELERAQLEESLKMSARTLIERNDSLIRNIENQRQAQGNLAHSYEILNATLNASKEGVLVVGQDDAPIAFNSRYIELVMLDQERMSTMSGVDLFRNFLSLATNPSLLYKQVDALSALGSDSHEVYRMKDGRWLEVYACRHSVAGLIWMLRDISEIYEKEATITFQAYHDSLTGLPNRVRLQERLEQAIATSQRKHRRFALCYLDLDGFKTINDSLGHNHGDELLKEVSARLQANLRKQDTLARVGGDEFVVIFEQVEGHEDVLTLAEGVLKTLYEPIRLDRREFVIGASMGIAMYPTDGEDSGILMRNADIAMYRAKANGKNCFHFFTPALERIALQRMSLETNLRSALEKNQLELFYQPKVCLRDMPDGMETGHLHSFEALLRWPQANGGFISPESFIHIAEDAGMIGRIGYWILQQACLQAKDWYDQGYSANISINISPRQFLIPNFHYEIIQIIRDMNVPVELISIEITESLLMQDLSHARAVLEYFRENGIFIYLDDFGTGFSSLNYLKNLPVDAIKIDRTFVKDLSSSSADQAIAASIITLGKNLDMLIVAEGIENAEQADFLIRNGCDLAQGYYYGHPVSAEQASLYLHPADRTCERLAKRQRCL